ncbi:MAG: tRNA (5-methylaminomethyl-2-thiouridine)(34)-methyltransferase MnmD [Flavobacteriia bacterium]|nr:tRNA (5-methylaminomethyl-2-thiouridine)(34)-methyltransferase MnmD [Flavobacteriia bacterium]
MINFKKEIVQTKDGSNTIFLPEINEHYHSHHGAIQESKHVFILNGLDYFKNVKDLKILEIGFGTGLNALLTYLYSQNKSIFYNGIEAFPLEMDLYSSLNFSTLIENLKVEIIEKIQLSEWNKEIEISPTFTLFKTNQKIQEYTLNNEMYDLIYFDAFGPRVQAEMWSNEILNKMYNSLKKGGIFVTYCAKGQVKRDLKAQGFFVETLEGPPGKREMTRAIKM